MVETTKPVTPGVMNRPVNDGKPAAPAAKPVPASWTVDDSEKLTELLDKRNAFLTTPRKRIKVGELRSLIGNMPADAEVMYEDWSDGGGVYVTEVTVGKNLLLLL